MRIGLGVVVFFKILLNAQFAAAVKGLKAAGGAPAEGPGAGPAADAAPARHGSRPPQKAAARSEALTLLATLQREARFVDMVKEPLGTFSDAQVGAAARDVLRECGKILDRLFGLRPLVELEEGTVVEVPVGYESGRYRLVGSVSGEPPFQGRLMHHGWQAVRCDVPTWSGADAARNVVAPQEVEVS
ncbi:MAG: DUF2760 domain-containing protein [Planctomycetes bacterium]|nr:DUF2760 domain-containing protein [Planctomycetota bacterium]